MEVIVVFIVIGLPIIGAFGYAAWRDYLKYRGSPQLQSRIEELEKRVKELEQKSLPQLTERVGTLEDIVISGDYELQQKLRQLESREQEQKALPPIEPIQRQ